MEEEKLYTYVKRTWKERLLTFPWQPWRSMRRVRDFRAEEAREVAQIQAIIATRSMQMENVLTLAQMQVQPPFEDTLALGLLMAEAVGPYPKESDPWATPEKHYDSAYLRHALASSQSAEESCQRAEFERMPCGSKHASELRSEKGVPSGVALGANNNDLTPQNVELLSWQNSSLDPSGVPFGTE